MIDTLPGHDFCSLSPPMANEIQYVTPDILRTELEAQDKRFEARFATRDELREEIRALEDRVESRAAERHAEVRAEFDRQRRELIDAIAAAARGLEESMRSQFAALDDKYRDVPPRVTKVEELTPRVEHLERTVFAPKPPPKKRRASGGKRRRA